METTIEFMGFIMCYGFIKCCNTMVLSVPVFMIILIIRCCNKKRNAAINYAAVLLMLPVAFTGMSKLFYTKCMVWANQLILGNVNAVNGTIYFTVAFILFLHFMIGIFKWKHERKNLYEWQDKGELLDIISKLCESDIFPVSRNYMKRVAVYITEEDKSPFSGGVIRPYIVLPEKVFTEWGKRERSVVLAHELIHIRSGHILWLNAFSLLRIYWWCNPLIYICERMYREDMELCCDEKVICYTGTKREIYRTALLNMAHFLSGGTKSGVAGFFRKSDFSVLKKRIIHIGSCRRYGVNIMRRQSAAVMLGLILAIASVLLCSYPRYTVIRDVSLYDGSLKYQDISKREMKQAVTVKDGKVLINENAFRKILDDYGIEGQHVYMAYDNIMKIPGVGGGGEAAMVNTEDFSDVFYLRADTLGNDIMIFLLKLI